MERMKKLKLQRTTQQSVEQKHKKKMSSARSHLIKSIIPPAKRRPMVGYVSSARLMSKTVKVRIPRVVVVPKYRKF